MSGKPFRLSIVSDVSDVLRGNRDIEGSLDDVADSLDDLARESEDAGRKLERGLSDGAEDAAREVERSTDKITDSLESTGEGARDAGRDIERHLQDGTEEAESAAEKMERTFRDAFDEVKQQSRTAGSDVGADARRSFGDAGEATQTFKDEARSNLSETFSSFRGDLEDIPQIFQDILGGVSADLGPAGAIGSLIGAAGLGLAVGFYQNWKEQTEKVEERISDMYEDMLESGQNFLSAQFLNTGISEILNSDEEAIISYAEAQKIAAETGIDLATVVRGYAGEAEAAEQVQGRLNERQRENADEINRLMREGYAGAANEVADVSVELREFDERLDEVNGRVATAAERAEVYRGAQVIGADAVRDHTEALAGMDDALREARESIATNNDELRDLGERATENDAVLAGLVGELVDLQDSAREAGTSTEELTELQANQAEQFIRTAEAAGYEAGEAVDLAEKLGLIPPEVATRIREHGASEVRRRAEEARREMEELAGSYEVALRTRFPGRWETQEQLNRLVWGLTAPPVVVQVRYGQSME